jgi:Lon protease-like protein
MFPLGSGLLPSAVLPLHIFEDRYRVMIRRVLDGEREFGVALIERGKETGGGEVRATTATIAQVIDAAEFDDGRWAIAAVGTRRVRVVDWLPDDPHPRAVVVDWPDELGDEVSPEQLDELIRRLKRVLGLAAELGHDVDIDPDLATDPALAGYQIGVLAPLGDFDRQRILNAPTVSDRLVMLGDMLEDQELLLQAQLRDG